MRTRQKQNILGNYVNETTTHPWYPDARSSVINHGPDDVILTWDKLAQVGTHAGNGFSQFGQFLIIIASSEFVFSRYSLQCNSKINRKRNQLAWDRDFRMHWMTDEISNETDLSLPPSEIGPLLITSCYFPSARHRLLLLSYHPIFFNRGGNKWTWVSCQIVVMHFSQLPSRVVQPHQIRGSNEVT